MLKILYERCLGLSPAAVQFTFKMCVTAENHEKMV